MTRASIKELKIGDWPYFVRPLGCRDGQQPTRVALTLFLPKRAILLLLRDSRRARQAWYPVKAQQPRSKAAVCVCVGSNNRRDGTRTTSYFSPHKQRRASACCSALHSWLKSGHCTALGMFHANRCVAVTVQQKDLICEGACYGIIVFLRGPVAGRGTPQGYSGAFEGATTSYSLVPF